MSLLVCLFVYLFILISQLISEKVIKLKKQYFKNGKFNYFFLLFNCIVKYIKPHIHHCLQLCILKEKENQ